MPGRGSNLVILGHSFTYANALNSPFYYLDLVELNDSVFLEEKGFRYEYVVNSREVVKPESAESVMYLPGYITLYTCYPKFIGNMRLIIKGKLVSIEQL